ncbi:hypothetical protein BDY24DRAFT_387955 [Mrakia frigida]|uniref:uncharacterized protein n=1 Tax=Mrakia frigida TaxID=29902 RepID=UPI003FCC214D
MSSISLSCLAFCCWRAISMLVAGLECWLKQKMRDEQGKKESQLFAFWSKTKTFFDETRRREEGERETRPRRRRRRTDEEGPCPPKAGLTNPLCCCC